MFYEAVELAVMLDFRPNQSQPKALAKQPHHLTDLGDISELSKLHFHNNRVCGQTATTQHLQRHRYALARFAFSSAELPAKLSSVSARLHHVQTLRFPYNSLRSLVMAI